MSNATEPIPEPPSQTEKLRICGLRSDFVGYWRTCLTDEYTSARNSDACVTHTLLSGVASTELGSANVIDTSKRKSDGQLARVATNLGIGVVGLVAVRLIVLNLPMFKDAGWIVENKLTVLAGAVIVVDAMLLTVLVRFAIEFRAYLFGRFAGIPGLGNMAANLVLLITIGIAYTDFKPLMRAWPSI